MNRRGFLAGMLATPFVAKAEFLMPVRQTVYKSDWFDLGPRDQLQALIYRLEPTNSPLLEAMARGEVSRSVGRFGRWWEEY